MKKIISILIAITVVTAMSIAMVGCDDPTKGPVKAEDLTLTSVTDEINITNGFTVDFKANYSLDDNSNTLEGTLKAKAEKKTEGDKTTYDPTVDLDLKFGATDIEYQRLYVRGSKVYSSNIGSSDITKEFFDERSVENFDFNGQMNGNSALSIVNSILNSQAGDLISLFDNLVEFKEDGTNFKSEVDIQATLIELVDTVNTVLNSLDDNSTINDVFISLALKDKLTKIFGDKKISEIYNIVKPVLIENGVTNVPQDTKALLELLKTTLSGKGINIEFPDVDENTTVVGFVDGLIAKHGDKKIIDLIKAIPGVGSTLGENLTMKSLVIVLKNIIKLDQFKPALENCTAKITIMANSTGKLSSVKADVKIDQALIDLINSFTTGSLPITSAVAASNPFFTLNASATIDTTAPTSFRDVTTLKTEKDIMKEIKGTYKTKSIKIGEKTYNLGDELPANNQGTDNQGTDNQGTNPNSGNPENVDQGANVNPNSPSGIAEDDNKLTADYCEFTLGEDGSITIKAGETTYTGTYTLSGSKTGDFKINIELNKSGDNAYSYYFSCDYKNSDKTMVFTVADRNLTVTLVKQTAAA